MRQSKIGRQVTCGAPVIALAIMAIVSAATSAAAISDDIVNSIIKPLPGDSASIRSSRDSTGRLKIEIAGKHYDGRRLIKELMAQLDAAEANAWLRDADLNIEIGTLKGFGGEEFRSFSLRLSTTAGSIRQFSLKSDGGPGGELRNPSGPDSTIRLETNDAGSLFRALDFYPRITGGRLLFTVDLAEEPSGTRKGQMTIGNYSISHDPTLDGMRRASKGAGADRVEFPVLEISFKWSSGELVFEHGYTCNPFMWSLMRGRLDLARNDMTVSGGFLYAFGRRIGRDLASESSPDNPMYLDYYVSGSIRKPTISINQSGVAAGAHRLLLRWCHAPSPPEPDAALP
jgi:hypothetical protein